MHVHVCMCTYVPVDRPHFFFLRSFPGSVASVDKPIFRCNSSFYGYNMVFRPRIWLSSACVWLTIAGINCEGSRPSQMHGSTLCILPSVHWQPVHALCNQKVRWIHSGKNVDPHVYVFHRVVYTWTVHTVPLNTAGISESKRMAEHETSRSHGYVDRCHVWIRWNRCGVNNSSNSIDLRFDQNLELRNQSDWAYSFVSIGPWSWK